MFCNQAHQLLIHPYRISCNDNGYGHGHFVILTISILSFLIGIFFIIPCVDNYLKVDLRVVSFDVPPQEVIFSVFCYLFPCSNFGVNNVETSEVSNIQ